MAKLYSRCVIVRSTRCEEGVSYGVPSDEEYHVRNLGRGLSSVEDEGGYRRILRTAELERLIGGLPRSPAGDYWSSGEPQYFISEVRIIRA